MHSSDQIRHQLARHLSAALRHTGATYTEIAAATGLDYSTIFNAIRHGVAECGDLTLICREIGLDAGAILADSAQNRAPDAPERPWCLHTPPASRYVEIHIHGAELLAQYLADRRGYLIGHDSFLPASEVPRWREASEAQLDRLNDQLAHQRLPA